MKNYIFYIVLVIFSSCGKRNEKPENPAPAAANLIFPEPDALCITGVNISDRVSRITFSWQAASNTTDYDLVIKNLLTGLTTTQSSATNLLAVELARNTPFSWYIVSKSNLSSQTIKSEVRKFYNAGSGIITYPPFPASIVEPEFGKILNGAPTVNLKWAGSDVENDIINYDVYFGQQSMPSLLKKNVTESFLNDVAISLHSTYYWKIVTRDALGNTSDSEVFQFRNNQ